MDANFKIKPLRQGLTVHLVFARPLLDWEGEGARFITALFDAISPKIPVLPNEFSFNQATVLGDIWVRYSIYGGASSIKLTSDRIVIEFPALGPADWPIALDLLHITHDLAPRIFPEQGCSRIESQTVEHLDFMLAGGVDKFLAQFRLPNIDTVFKDAAITQLPSVKFGMISELEKWQYTFMAERSQLSANAIFVLRTLIQRPADLTAPFEKKLELAQSAVIRLFAALGLEFDSDATST